MSTIQDNDQFLVQRGTDSYKQSAKDLMSTIQDDDLMLIQRGEDSYKVRCEDVKDQLGGGGGGGAPVISVNCTLVASSEYQPSTLTATGATVINGTKVESHAPWYKDGVEIAGATGLTLNVTAPGVYKYEERWVGGDGSSVYPSATVTIKKAVIAKPTVIAPANGAGVGGDTKYKPMTSAVDSVKDDELPSNSKFVDGQITLAGSTNYVNGKNNWNDIFANDTNTASVVMNNSAGNVIADYWFADTTNGVYVKSIQFKIRVVGSTGKLNILGLDGSQIAEPSINNSITTRTVDINNTIKGFQIQQNSGGDNNVEVYNVAFDGRPWGTAETKLTLTNNKVYDSSNGEEVSNTLDAAFTAGTVVKGQSATTPADTAAFGVVAYDGASSTTYQTGVDNTKGNSLIWIKSRTSGGALGANYTDHALFDNVRPAPNDTQYYALATNSVGSQTSAIGALNFAFLSDGFEETSNSAYTNFSGRTYVAWNFRAAPKFFDIVTYDGNSDLNLIPHKLGTTPGFVVVKKINNQGNPGNWSCWHKSISDKFVLLNNTQEAHGIGQTRTVTDTEYQVFGGWADENYLGSEYVAYLFADTPGLIKCGKYQGTNVSGNFIECGFKPGWVMIKNITADANWFITDSARGDHKELYPNTSGTETTTANYVTLDANGFTVTNNQTISNDGRYEYIYVAIAENAQAGQFPPTGTVVSADTSTPSLTLKDVTGTWAKDMKAVGQTEFTQVAPDPDTLEFVGSVPAASAGTISTWGDATWTVSQVGSGQGQSTTTAITPNQQQKLKVADTGMTLSPGTTYDVTVKYEAPDAVGATSDANRFKTASADGWFAGTAPADTNTWFAVAYGNGKYVAVANSGSTPLMYSSDGVTWTKDNVTGVSAHMQGVAFGGGKFVAVGTGNVIYSTDGITWSNDNVVGPPMATWQSLTYGDGKFVAVSSAGYVMCSSDGLNWTADQSAIAPVGSGVVYGNGLFVAVHTNAVYYSSDGVNWSNVDTTVPDGRWYRVAYGNGKFVATGYTGTPNVMTSTDGKNWTASAPLSVSNEWYGLCFGDGKFITVAYDGTDDRIASSTDGVNWTPSAAPVDGNWHAVVYGDNKYVAISYTGGATGVIWSVTGLGRSTTERYFDTHNLKSISDVNIERRYGVEADSNAAKQLGFAELTEQPTYDVAGYELQANGKYKPIEDQQAEVRDQQEEIRRLKKELVKTELEKAALKKEIKESEANEEGSE